MNHPQRQCNYFCKNQVQLFYCYIKVCPNHRTFQSCVMKSWVLSCCSTDILLFDIFGSAFFSQVSKNLVALFPFNVKQPSSLPDVSICHWFLKQSLINVIKYQIFLCSSGSREGAQAPLFWAKISEKEEKLAEQTRKLPPPPFSSSVTVALVLVP